MAYQLSNVCVASVRVACDCLLTRFLVYRIHKTIAEKGSGEEQDALLCVYLGSNDPELWPHVLNNIGDESGYYSDPFKGFIKNENVDPDKDICL